MPPKKNPVDPQLEIGPVIDAPNDQAMEDGTDLILVVPTFEAILPPRQEQKIIADMSAMIKKYTGFVIKTKADYEQLKADHTSLRSKRTAIDGKDGWRLSVKRLADKIGERLLGHIEPVEQLLAAIKKTYDDAEAEKARLIKEAKERLIASRKQELFTIGAMFNGSAFVMGTVQVYPEDLETDDYLPKIDAVKTEKARLDELERVRKEQEEADRKKREEEAEEARLAQVAKDEAAAKLAAENAALLAKIAALEAKTALADVPAVVEQPKDVPPKDKEPDLFTKGYTTARPSVHEITEAQDKQAARLQTPDGLAEHIAKTQPPVVVPASEKFQRADVDFIEGYERHIYDTGAYDFAQMARKALPEIPVSTWKELWATFRQGIGG